MRAEGRGRRGRGLAAAVAREGSEVRGARGSGSGRLGLRLRLLQRPPSSGPRSRSSVRLESRSSPAARHDGSPPATSAQHSAVAATGR